MSKKKKDKPLAQPVMFPTVVVSFPNQTVDDYLDDLQDSKLTIEEEVEKEKSYLNRLLKNKKTLKHIKCK